MQGFFDGDERYAEPRSCDGDEVRRIESERRSAQIAEKLDIVESAEQQSILQLTS